MGRASRGGESRHSRSSSSRSSSRSSSSRSSSYSSRPIRSTSRPSRSSYGSSGGSYRSSSGGSGRSSYSGSNGGYSGSGSGGCSSDDTLWNRFSTGGDYIGDFEWYGFADDDWMDMYKENSNEGEFSEYKKEKTYARSGMDYAFWIVVAMLLGTFILGMIAYGDTGGIPDSNTDRIKIRTASDFDEDCIIDELDWFENESNAQLQLERFYELTGVQPYIALLEYNEAFDIAGVRESYANETLYEEMCEHRSSVIYVYFAAEDVNEMGYELFVTGPTAKLIIDDEAREIFWAYLDKYWSKNISTDDVFVKTFNSTAERIMGVGTGGFEISAVLVFAIVIIVGAVCILVYMGKKE